MPKEKRITGKLRPSGAGVVQPQAQRLPARFVGAGQIAGGDDWVQLGKALENMGEASGVLLRNLIKQRSSEDLTEGSALAIKRAGEYRKFGAKSLIKAEQDGLFNGRRPDVLIGYRVQAGRNYARSAEFKTTLAAGIDQKVSESLKQGDSMDDFNGVLREHLNSVLTKSQKDTPNNWYFRNAGFLPVAQQQIDQLIKDTSDLYADGITKRNTGVITEGLSTAFKEGLSGGNDFSRANKYFASGTFLTDEELRRTDPHAPPIPASEYRLPNPPKHLLPKGVNAREYFFKVFKVTLDNNTLPDGHYDQEHSLKRALHSVQAFKSLKMYGTGTNFYSGKMEPIIDAYEKTLYTKALIAQKAGLPRRLAAKKESTDYVTEILTWAVQNSTININGEEVKPDIRGPNARLHQMKLMNLWKDGKLRIRIPSGDTGEGASAFKEITVPWGYNPNNSWGFPSQAAFDMFENSDFMDASSAALKEARAVIDGEISHKGKMKTKFENWAATEMKDRAEFALKMYGLTFQGDHMTEKEAMEVSLSVEDWLEEATIPKEYAMFATEGGHYDYSLADIFQLVNTGLKNHHPDKYHPSNNQVLHNLFAKAREIDPTNIQATAALRKSIVGHKHMSLEQKAQAIALMEGNIKALSSTIDISTKANHDVLDAIKSRILTIDRSIVPLIAAFKNEDRIQKAVGNTDRGGWASDILHGAAMGTFATTLTARAAEIVKHFGNDFDNVPPDLWNRVLYQKSVYMVGDSDPDDPQSKIKAGDPLIDQPKPIRFKDPEGNIQSITPILGEVVYQIAVKKQPLAQSWGVGVPPPTDGDGNILRDENGQPVTGLTVLQAIFYRLNVKKQED